MEHDASLWAAVAATFVLAGLVKGMIGLGLPTVAMALLGLVMPPVQAAALLVVPSLVTNVWQLAAGPRFLALAGRLWPLLAGIGLGTWGGVGLLDGWSAAEARRTLGVILVVYAGLGLTDLHFRVPPAWERWLALPVGVVTGALTLATGMFVIPAVPYLGALGLSRDELIQALGLSFTVSTLTLAVALAAGEPWRRR
ncbi:MAG: sulfite exporter TauE/SafE family protein [Magnetospirillum sp.]|nr:sulfite exporter TauE/SafE family protein [Magnetospirillum sp.]